MAKEIHKHVFDKMVKSKVMLHDDHEVATGESTTGGNVVGFDMLKQRKCKCGATETYDLERTKL